MPLDALSRRLLRQAVLRVHPDFFSNAPEAASLNAESLVKLNSFVEILARGARPRATRLDFWIYEDREGEEEEEQKGTGQRTTRRVVSASLPRSGSLLPLFAALGLATAEELSRVEEGEAEAVDFDDGGGLGAEEADLLEWLRSAARSAAAAGGKRAALLSAVGAAAADAAQRHALVSPIALPDCRSFATSSRAALVRALKATRALDDAMARFEEEGERPSEIATEEEQGGGEQQSDGGGGGGGGGGGDESSSSSSSDRCTSKPFRGLRVRLYTPPSSRRRAKRSEKGKRPDAEGEASVERAPGEEGEEAGGEEEEEGATCPAASAWVSPSDGSLCVLLASSSSPASPASFLRALRSESVDLPTARALSAARAYWQRRAAELAAPAAAALGVERVCWAEEEEEGGGGGESEEATGEDGGDSSFAAGEPPPSAAQRFVAWAAAVLGEAAASSPPPEEEGAEASSLERRKQGEGGGEESLSLPLPRRRRRLSLSVVVHSEAPEQFFSSAFFVGESAGTREDGEAFAFSSSEASSSSSFNASRPPHFQISAGTLHVSAASPPGQLLAFLRSEDGAAAALAAEQEAKDRERAERAMGAAARALGAAAVVRVSPTASLEEVSEAAGRLAASAPLLAAAGIDLTGVTLAIDDVFEAWHDDDESGSDSDEEEEGGKRRYCGILSVPFDFEAPDLGAAVARMMRTSLPSSSSSSDEGGGAFADFEPSETSGKNVFGVSAPRASATARTALLRPLLPLPLSRVRGGPRETGGARRRRPSRAEAAAAAVAPPRAVRSTSFALPVRSLRLRRLCVL